MPFKFVPYNMTGMHFDSKWYCKQIRSFELKAFYKQKWIKSVTTPLQIESSLTPDNLKLVDSTGAVVKQFIWVVKVTATNYKIYETTFDVSDKADGTYFLYQRVAFGDINWETISEPIAVASAHTNVILFKYSNSINKDDVAWTTGLRLTFMCEADIQDYEPSGEETDYVNQNADTETLDGIATRSFQLYIGDTKNGVSGVPPYMVDILNRIFLGCDKILISDDNTNWRQYDNKSQSKFKVTRTRGYPLIGASLDLVESQNLQSLEFADTTPLAAGIVTMFEMQTGFFGPAGLVNVTEVEENE